MRARVNHTHIHEVQSITQLFFPNSRFYCAGMDAAHGQGYSVASILWPEEAYAAVYLDGEIICERHWPLGASPHVTDKRALMLSLFYALKEATGVNAPWGSLTGIRPSKMARAWMDEGLSAEEIIHLLQNPFGCRESKARLAVKTAVAEKYITEQIYNMAGMFTPLGLYISIPFCPSRCLYCSFNMGKNYKNESFFEAYLNALEKDMAEKASTAREMGGALTSVYIGGGTPTVLSVKLLDKLLMAVENCFGSRVFGMEYTVEAGRPDSLTEEKLKLLKDYGVNRVAINPQTLNDATLKAIGRSHSSADFFNAFALAGKVGFSAINTDVIAGLPGETARDMENTLREMVKLKPENITVHTLAVKRASRLNEYLNDYRLTEAGEADKMLEISQQLCEAAGLAPYYLYRQKNAVGLLENTGYSLPGYECTYNVGMMAETQTVLGVGAGAVCKFVNGSKITRAFNPKNPEIYVERRLNHVNAST